MDAVAAVLTGCRFILTRLLLFVVCGSFGFAGHAYAAGLTFLDPHGAVAAAQRQHFIDVLLIMMIVIVPVLIGVPLIAWRYRYRNTAAHYTPRWGWSKSLELLVWGVPLAVVGVMAFWLVQNTTALDPYRPIKGADKPLKVDVIAYDWKWLFVYPQLHIATVGQLVFPEHTPIAMRLTSASVMQSFFIPALGSQVYAMAAMQTKLHLIADSTGQFQGENTQYDGMGFQHQKFIARATTPAGFRDWVASVQANGIPLTAKVYRVIRRDNTVSEIRTALKPRSAPPDAVFFSHVQPNLFENVMMSFHGGATTSRAIVGARTKASLSELSAHPNKFHATGMD